MTTEITQEVTQVVSLTEAKDYLGIDYTDDMIERRINSVIKSADLFIQGALGDDYPRDDHRVKEVALMFIGDVFDNRQLSSKGSSAYKQIATNMLQQIRLELIREREAD